MTASSSSSPSSPQPGAVRTRFAPSPSGHLHVGGARTALFCWAYAKGRGGTFILRIEDTDQRRSSEAASVGFLRDLHWLGIKWDEGPEFWDCGGGEYGPYFQSERLDLYNRHLDQLIRAGHAYYAFDTPEELEAQRKAARAANKPYRYNRAAALSLSPETVERRLAEGRPAVIRFKVPSEPVTIHDEVLGDATIPEGEIDDFVIRKADGFPTYHFAVVVDDETMRCTHVLRAQEHFNNTAKHLLLQDALGFHRPVYAHLPLIVNPDGSKMSKRDKDKLLRATVRERGLSAAPGDVVPRERFDAWLADKDKQLDFDDANALADALGVQLPEINVDDFRRSGYLPQVLCNFLALNGWSPGKDVERFDNAFLAERFDFDRVLKAPARFDRAKLLAFNLDALQALPLPEFTRLLREHGQEYHEEFLGILDKGDRFELFAAATKERSKTLDEPFRANRFLVVEDDELVYDLNGKSTLKVMVKDDGLAHLANLKLVLGRLHLHHWNMHEIEKAVKAYADERGGGQLGKVAQPLRVAVAGTTVSPPIFHTLELLGRGSVLRRIERCLEQPWGAEA